MVEVDATIVGAGVVGLSIARELGNLLDNVVVFEQEPRPGMGISSRNSEVIHAGIYYSEGSLKALLCVTGSRMLFDFCSAWEVPFRKIGKVIVATEPEEEKAIEKLFQQGSLNDVRELRLLGKSELRNIEPNVSGCSALLSPYTGIVDSHRLIKTLEAHCLGLGVSIFYRTPLLEIQKNPGGFVCRACSNRGEPYSFLSRIVINAAGLSADKIASLAGIDIDRAGYRLYPVKGEYFRVREGKNTLVNGLVYPVPERNLTGLGIHATKDLSGSLRLGPNAFPVEAIDFDIDISHAELFYESARHILPFLDPEDLAPDMAGIRPKIQKPGGPQRDFVISHEDESGLAGMINLIGIESPGLTSCLAIGRYVADMVKNSGLIS